MPYRGGVTSPVCGVRGLGKEKVGSGVEGSGETVGTGWDLVYDPSCPLERVSSVPGDLVPWETPRDTIDRRRTSYFVSRSSPEGPGGDGRLSEGGVRMSHGWKDGVDG